MSPLTESIVDTLAFFAIFEYPLTATEIYNYLWQPPVAATPTLVIVELEALVRTGAIMTRDGYYALGGIEQANERRRAAHWLVAHKLRRARRALRWAEWVPFMQAVFICNTVAFGWPRAESDIDVFVVVRKNRLWLTRLLVTAAIGLSGYRRHGVHVADRVCLSFYITDEALDLAAVRIGEDDVLLTYWTLFLHPLYDPNSVATIVQDRNSWAKKIVPFMPADTQMRSIMKNINWSGLIKRWFEKILGRSVGDWLNYQAGLFQKNKMKLNRQSVQNCPDSRVVISDSMLKFHENDRRDLYRKQWNANRYAVKARLLVWKNIGNICA